jgi:hypothetical protein
VTKTTSTFSTFLHFVATPVRGIANLFGRVQHENPEIPAAAGTPGVLLTHDGTPVHIPTPVRSAPPAEEDQTEFPILKDIAAVEEAQTQRVPVAAAEPISFDFDTLRTTEKLGAPLERGAEEPPAPAQQVPPSALCTEVSAPAAGGEELPHDQVVDETGYETEDTVVEEGYSPEQEIGEPDFLKEVREEDMALNEGSAVAEEPHTEIIHFVVEAVAAHSSPKTGSDASPLEAQIESPLEEGVDGPAQERRASTAAAERKKRRHRSHALPTPPLHVCQQGLFRRRVYKIN